MIIEFSVTNFGPIKTKQTLSFEATNDDTLEDYYVHEPIPGLRLLKFAILYGPNASGKSTILKALDFLRKLVLNPEDKKTDKLDFEPFLFDENTPLQPSELNLSFIQNKIKYNYTIVFTKDLILKEELDYQPKGRSAVVYTRETNVENRISEINFGSTIKILKEDRMILRGNTISNNSVLGAYNKSNINSPELDEVFGWFKDELMRLIQPQHNLFSWTSDRVEKNENGFRQKVIDIIRKADIQINNIEIDVDEEEISKQVLDNIDKLPISNEAIEKIKTEKKFVKKDVIFHHNISNNGNVETYHLSKDFESLGTKRYYELSGILATLIDEEKVVCIDEIETSLHPDLMKHFILTYLVNSRSSQLLISTHNVFLLSEKDMLRNDAIWFTEKQLDGSTDLFSLDDFDSSTLRKGTSIINAYKIGKLGAKPNLGSYFINTYSNGKE
ncbi:ATP-binding protein [Halosquirtibacter laminarini]|uniref:ATP-binding protein n=1 Tax=Halosquirtibacter laminarini TaxID=3374600 RepID=A0AC61NI05_9BACT|nr:ATP-binding protein [Prolixibacteraceae bacterium]